MDEYLDIRDWDGNLTGEKKERGTVHREGDIHGTSHIWLIRRNEETGSADVLLQKRAADKDAFHGCYDTSSAGHIPSGGDFMESALRELKEELGISAEQEELQHLFWHRQTVDTEFHGQRFYDRQISAVYVCVRNIKDEEFCLQKEEVEEVRWMDYEECMQHILRKDPKFCIHPDEYGRVCEYIRTKVLRMEGKEELTTQEPKGRAEEKLSPTWNEDCLAELDEWIESQGIYLRQ